VSGELVFFLADVVPDAAFCFEVNFGSSAAAIQEAPAALLLVRLTPASPATGSGRCDL
jgi:hypothetical protein